MLLISTTRTQSLQLFCRGGSKHHNKDIWETSECRHILKHIESPFDLWQTFDNRTLYSFPINIPLWARVPCTRPARRPPDPVCCLPPFAALLRWFPRPARCLPKDTRYMVVIYVLVPANYIGKLGIRKEWNCILSPTRMSYLTVLCNYQTAPFQITYNVKRLKIFQNQMSRA